MGFALFCQVIGLYYIVVILLEKHIVQMEGLLQTIMPQGGGVGGASLARLSVAVAVSVRRPRLL